MDILGVLAVINTYKCVCPYHSPLPPSLCLSVTISITSPSLPLSGAGAVVVDRREDKDCDTGGFELAYKQVTKD